MDLTLLRTFVTVHRAGSFTRAARLLGLSQPAVTGQIRSLERLVGRPLFLRLPRGVSPTTAGDELARKVAPHLDALLEIAQADLYDDSPRTLYLAVPAELASHRVLPALAPLVGEGLALRVALGRGEENLAGLAAGHYDLTVGLTRPKDRLLTSTVLCDEEYVLVASPERAADAGGRGPEELERIPIVETGEDLPLVTRYWSAVFDTGPSVDGTVVVPDLRAVLACVRAGAGLAVLPRHLCRADLEAGTLVALLDPPVPPLRTYFLSARIGTLARPHIARAHARLLSAAARW
ncbi:LysR family transcriptional regulator [Streptomyces sp. SCUT-3]|uniref:LysR family transcriptional regulator n=1 Tax=unclassified Streptomyces TaxID=2593676 RepID=UPI000CBEDD34|nr:LysR family transcriptional regulator [Streptomyces sp. SCUT-3]PLW73723.1 LysR family transcriptional regulator [Streptomyces sp. DJ]QMV22540.1 LysR family transcriptional regulator [Streptomyces sp. SCUT-3]